LVHPDLGSRLAAGSSHASRTYRARDGGAGLRRIALETLAARAEVVYIFAQKYFRMCHLPSPVSAIALIGRVRKQRDVAGALNRFRQHALMRRTITGDSPRQNLPSLGKVVLQQPDILEIDQVYFVDTKTTNAPPVHASRAAAAAHWASIRIVITIVATTTAHAVFIIRCHNYTLESSLDLFAGLSELHSWPARLCTLRRTLRDLARTALFQLLRAPSIFIDSHRDVPQHTIVNAHATFEFGNLTARSFDLQKHKRAVFVVQYLVGQLAFAHDFALRYRATLVCYDLRKTLS
jgi:hypothetical protein